MPDTLFDLVGVTPTLWYHVAFGVAVNLVAIALIPYSRTRAATGKKSIGPNVGVVLASSPCC